MERLDPCLLCGIRLVWVCTRIPFHCVLTFYTILLVFLGFRGQRGNRIPRFGLPLGLSLFRLVAFGDIKEAIGQPSALNVTFLDTDGLAIVESGGIRAAEVFEQSIGIWQDSTR